jgi:hypothetical protein
MLVGLFNFYWCGFDCKIERKNLFFALYYLVIAEYLTSCMAMFNLFIQIFLSIQRILIVTNKKFLQNASICKVILTLLLLSLIFYIPVLTVLTIVNEKYNTKANNESLDESLYSVVSTDFGKSSAGTSVKTLVQVGRISIATVIFGIVNFLNYIAFRRFLNKRTKLLSVCKSSNKSIY